MPIYRLTIKDIYDNNYREHSTIHADNIEEAWIEGNKIAKRYNYGKTAHINYEEPYTRGHYRENPLRDLCS